MIAQPSARPFVARRIAQVHCKIDRRRRMADGAAPCYGPAMGFDWKIVIPWLLSVVTVAAGVWQYADKQAQANREPFLREQLKLVFEASETVAKLANVADPKLWQEARTRFWVLYWGPLGLVEDGVVARCMIKAGRIVPGPEQTALPPLPLTGLQQTSIQLSHAARNLILDSWDVSLPPLQNLGAGELCH
jgi:hypothetical protein